MLLDLEKENYSENTNCFCNAAISSRLGSASSEFLVWFSDQYSDVIQVVKDIRNQKIKSISKETSIDLFVILLVHFCR